MMGNTIEFYAADTGADPAATPDWLIGEDVITGPTCTGFPQHGRPAGVRRPRPLLASSTPARRTTAACTATAASPTTPTTCAVNGGKNAGCGGIGHPDTRTPRTATSRSPALGLDAGRSRSSTTASRPAASTPTSATRATAPSRSRRRVQRQRGRCLGRRRGPRGCTPAPPPPAPCATDTAVSSTPFESTAPLPQQRRLHLDVRQRHSPGSRSTSRLLDTEQDFDYVYVEDADGNVLKAYTGTYKRGRDVTVHHRHRAARSTWSAIRS